MQEMQSFEQPTHSSKDHINNHSISISDADHGDGSHINDENLESSEILIHINGNQQDYLNPHEKRNRGSNKKAQSNQFSNNAKQKQESMVMNAALRTSWESASGFQKHQNQMSHHQSALISMNPLTYSNNLGSMTGNINTNQFIHSAMNSKNEEGNICFKNQNMGGIDNDVECKESDFLFLQEVIQNVKTTYDSTQYTQLTEYIENVISNFKLEENEEWEIILAEVKEMHRTFKKVIDISGKKSYNLNSFQYFYWIKLKFLQIKTWKFQEQIRSYSNNFHWLKMTMIVFMYQNINLNFNQEECKTYSQRINNQNEAIKSYEKNILQLNEQILSQIELIKRLEHESVSVNTSLDKSSLRQSALRTGEALDQQMILNEKNRKIDELENLLAEYNTKYYQESNKNYNLSNTLKNFKQEYDLIRLQNEDLFNFLEEKDAKIIELEETIKGQEEIILRKNLELKNQKLQRPIIKMNNPLAATQMQIERDNNPQLQQENIFDISTYSINREHEENEDAKTKAANDGTKRIIKITRQTQKMSEQLDKAMSKLRTSIKITGAKTTKNNNPDKSFQQLQRSFILQQRPNEPQYKTSHKRMQTIDSTEVMQSLESPDFQKRQGEPNNLIAGQYKQVNIFTHSTNQNLNVMSSLENNLSPTFSPLEKVTQSRQPNYNNQSMNIYEEVDEEMVEMRSTQRKQSGKDQSNLIGVNESDLMEFPNNPNFPYQGTSANQSAMDFSQYNDTQRSLIYSQNQQYPHRTSNKYNQRSTSKKNEGTPDSKILRETNKSNSRYESPAPSQILTNNIFNLQSKLKPVEQTSSSLLNQGSTATRNPDELIINPSEQTKLSPTNMIRVNGTNNYTLSFNHQQQLKSTENSITKRSRQQQLTESTSNGILNSQGSKKQNGSGQCQEEELKLEFLQQNVKDLKIGNRIRPTPMGLSDGKYEENKQNPHHSVDINCIIVDQNDTQLNVQRSYNQSLIDSKAKFADITQNKNMKQQIDILKHDSDANYQFFYLTVVAYLMRHFKHSYLFQVSIEEIFEEATQKKVKFQDYYKWVNEKMLQVHYQWKRSKKANLKTTFLDPSSTNQNLQKSSSLQIIDNHFKKL